MATSSGSGAVPVATYGGPVYFRGGSLYALVDGRSWGDAEAKAVALGGHLATVTSPEEDSWLQAALHSAGVAGAFIGATDASDEGVWTWVDGTPFVYSNWASGQPDGSDDGFDYASLLVGASDSNAGQWSSAPLLSGTARVDDAGVSLSDRALGVASEASPWSYGRKLPGDPRFTPYSDIQVDFRNVNASVAGYFGPQTDEIILVNYGQSAYNLFTGFVPPQTFELHTGSGGAMPTIRYTAQEAGRFRLNWFYQDLNTNGGDGATGTAVLNESSVIDSVTWGGGDATEYQFEKSLDLAAGDTIDFQLFYNGDYTYDSTGFGVSISSDGLPQGVAELPISFAIAFESQVQEGQPLETVPREGLAIRTVVALQAANANAIGLADGTRLYWSLGGIAADDLDSTSDQGLNGSGVLSSGQFSFLHVLKADTDVEVEDFIVTLFADPDRMVQVGQPISARIIDTSPVSSAGPGPTDTPPAPTAPATSASTAVAPQPASQPSGGITFPPQNEEPAISINNAFALKTGDEVSVPAGEKAGVTRNNKVFPSPNAVIVTVNDRDGNPVPINNVLVSLLRNGDLPEQTRGLVINFSKAPIAEGEGVKLSALPNGTRGLFQRFFVQSLSLEAALQSAEVSQLDLTLQLSDFVTYTESYADSNLVLSQGADATYTTALNNVIYGGDGDDAVVVDAYLGNPGTTARSYISLGSGGDVVEVTKAALRQNKTKLILADFNKREDTLSLQAKAKSVSGLGTDMLKITTKASTVVIRSEGSVIGKGSVELL